MEESKNLSSFDFLEHFEQAFNCPVCLCPKIRMVFGICQHKVCADCLYDKNRCRNGALDRCPVCMKGDAFPSTLPDIPKDNELMLYQAGIRKCEVEDCEEEIWIWNLRSHEIEHERMVKPQRKRSNDSLCKLDHYSLHIREEDETRNINSGSKEIIAKVDKSITAIETISKPKRALRSHSKVRSRPYNLRTAPYC